MASGRVAVQPKQVKDLLYEWNPDMDLFSGSEPNLGWLGAQQSRSIGKHQISRVPNSLHTLQTNPS